MWFGTGYYNPISHRKCRKHVEMVIMKQLRDTNNGKRFSLRSKTWDIFLIYLHISYFVRAPCRAATIHEKQHQKHNITKRYAIKKNMKQQKKKTVDIFPPHKSFPYTHLNDFPHVSTSLKIHAINILNETIYLKLHVCDVLKDRHMYTHTHSERENGKGRRRSNEKKTTTFSFRENERGTCYTNNKFISWCVRMKRRSGIARTIVYTK